MYLFVDCLLIYVFVSGFATLQPITNHHFQLRTNRSSISNFKTLEIDVPKLKFKKVEDAIWMVQTHTAIWKKNYPISFYWLIGIPITGYSDLQ